MDAALARHGLWWALAVGLALRLLWAWWIPVAPVSDSFVYQQFAESIVNGRGYAYADGTLTAFWPVGTSAVYAALFSVFGVSYGPIVALNLLLGAGVILLTHGIAARHADRRTAVLAAMLVAVWPLLIQFTTVLASELLFVFLLLAAVYAWGTTSLPTVPRSMLFGALLCGATYVRPTALPLLVMLPLVQAWMDRAWRGAALSLIVASLTAAALFAPWAARNHEVFGRFALVSTNFGQNLWMGNNPKSTGAYMPLDVSMANEAEAQAFYRQRAIDFIRDNPLEYLRLSLKRIVGTYDRESIGVSWNEKGLAMVGGSSLLTALKAASTLYWWIVLALGAAGVCIALRTGVVGWIHPLTWVPALFFVVPILTVSQDRYHVPLNPFIAVFAAIAVWRLHDRWHRRATAAVPAVVRRDRS